MFCALHSSKFIYLRHFLRRDFFMRGGKRAITRQRNAVALGVGLRARMYMYVRCYSRRGLVPWRTCWSTVDIVYQVSVQLAIYHHGRLTQDIKAENFNILGFV